MGFKYKIGDIVDVEGRSEPGKIIGYEKSNTYQNINGKESEHTFEEYVIEIGTNEFYFQEDAILGLHYNSVEEKVNPLSLNTDVESVQVLIKSFNELNEKLNKLNETLNQLKIQNEKQN